MNVNVRRLVVLLACIVCQLHAAADWIGRKVVLKDPIVEMGTSVVPKVDGSVCWDVPGSCHRAHHGLLNEVVTCVAERAAEDELDTEIQVNFPSIIYGFDKETQKPLGDFWMKKTQALVYDDVPEEIQEAVPAPVGVHDNSVVTLVYRWKQFSLGTRFKRASYWDTNNAYAILCPDYEDGLVRMEFVPRRDALPNEYRTPQEARECFVNLINTFIDRVSQEGDDFVVPYVWGGSSFINACKQGEFYKKDGGWHRNKAEGSRYTGYDCSEFIMRMAQVAGIDFPWKVTPIMEKMLTKVAPGDTVQNGDIIWVSGHVMLASDVHNNQVIEARGYKSGFGCVHRIALPDLFSDGAQDIESFDDLLAHSHANKLIYFKDINGNVVPQASERVAILRLVAD